MFNKSTRRNFISHVGILGASVVLYSCKRNILETYGEESKTAASPYIYFIGDSLTFGIGTSGTAASAANPPVIGNHTYPKQTVKLLGDVGYEVYGYPGFTAENFCSTKSAGVLNSIDNSSGLKIAVIFFGANDLITTGVDKVYANLKATHQLFRDKGLKTMVVPVLNRVDRYATQPDFDNARHQLNQLLQQNYQTFADAYADLSHEPNIFADDAPDNAAYFAVNDVDGLTGVHMTDLGAGCMATEVAKAVKALAAANAASF